MKKSQRRYHEKMFARWLRLNGISEGEAFDLYDKMWSKESCCDGHRMPTIFDLDVNFHVKTIRLVRKGP